MTLKGEITSAPTNFATTTFTITVLDPCLSTIIYPIPTISDMTTSVLLASGAITQLVGPIQDQVSVSHGSTGTEYCSQRKYSISSVISTTATTALDSSSLTIGLSTGQISV